MSDVDDGSKVQYLLDYIAIRELTARYNRAWDDGEAENWAQTFAEDGVMVIPPEQSIVGRQALKEMLRGAGSGFLHITADPIVEVDGNEARQTCTYVVGRGRGKRDRIDLTLTGRYADELVRTPQGWLFQRRTVTVDTIDPPGDR